MENPNERCLLHRAAFKHRDIIAKSAKCLELERERELERIAKAIRDAAPIAEQHLLNSNENERAMENRLAIRQQLRFRKAARRAPRRAMNAIKLRHRKAVRRASRRAMKAMKKTVEIADGTFDFPLLMDATSNLYGSRTIFEDVTGLRLVQETEDDVREFDLAID